MGAHGAPYGCSGRNNETTLGVSADGMTAAGGNATVVASMGRRCLWSGQPRSRHTARTEWPGAPPRTPERTP
jgi:hypothetical protein